MGGSFRKQIKVKEVLSLLGGNGHGCFERQSDE